MDMPGFFIEVGSDDGVRFSNTLFFERSLGWFGICIEPKPTVFSLLQQNRKSICLNYAISSEDGKTEEFLEIEGYGRQLSGIVKHYDIRHLERISREKNHPQFEKDRIISVPVRTLNSILQEYKVCAIDFLSIDTEGSEVVVLSSIDLEKYPARVILIENNYQDDYAAAVPQLKEFYSLYHRLAHDEIWVRNR
jgi:FkbM family methyltransferase